MFRHSSSERCLVVGLPRLGLDSSLFTALDDVGRDVAVLAHGTVVY